MQGILKVIVGGVSAKRQRLGHFLQFCKSAFDLLVVFLDFRIEGGVALQLGAIYPHGQLLQVTQLRHLNHLRLVDLVDLLSNLNLIVGIVQGCQFVAQDIGTSPLSPALQ